jgi:predicted neuraminidase
MIPDQIVKPDSRQTFNKVTAIVVCACLYFLAWTFLIPHPGLTRFKLDRTFADSPDAPYYSEGFASSAPTLSSASTLKVHAATITATENELIACWYGGTREGAHDVQVFQASFANNNWSNAHAVVGPEKVQSDLSRYVRKVGNPAVFYWPDGRTWLFFVSVSVGGWGGSSINLLESEDGGRTWGKVRRLITSPFLNLSTLVRNSPVIYTDGSIGLPVYHEFLGKFGEILRIDPNGRILGKVRLSMGKHSLQPVIVPTSQTMAIGLMRYAGTPPMRLLQFKTTDGGVSWSTPSKLAVQNPNSSVDAIHIGDGRILAAINNTTMSRASLHLAISSQGQHWNIFHELEAEDVSPVSHAYEFSYPSITRDKDGMFHLLYSWNLSHIKHVSFNEAWLNEKLMASHSAVVFGR